MKTKQRGSAWSIKLVFNLYKLLGYKFIYYLMYPVTFFYYLRATNVRNALEIYYKNIGIPFSNKIYFHHLRLFAITMVDRFIVKAAPQDYSFTYDNPERPLEIFSKASILLLSHFGGWASASNVSRSTNKINIVMQEALKDGIKDIEDSLEIKSTINIIDLNKGPIAVSIAIANALMNDEVVGIMGDRASNPNATLSLDFFGKKAKFNKNPFQIAYKMKVPMVAYFVVWTGMQEYKIEFLEIDLDQELKADEAIEKAMKEYVQRYENLLKSHPNQWLNFYDFWEIQD